MKRYIVFVVCLSLIVIGVQGQDNEAYFEPPTKKELRASKKAEKIELLEAYKNKAMCQIKEGNFVLKANQIFKGTRNIHGVSPQANFLKIEGDIIFSQSRVEYSSGGPSGRAAANWIHETEFIDLGPGKPLKVRFRYGMNPVGGTYGFADLTITGKTAFVRFGTGRLQMQGIWGELKNMVVDNTTYQMAVNKLPAKRYGQD